MCVCVCALRRFLHYITTTFTTLNIVANSGVASTHTLLLSYNHDVEGDDTGAISNDTGDATA